MHWEFRSSISVDMPRRSKSLDSGPSQNDLVDNLWRHREAVGLTQDQVAEELNRLTGKETYDNTVVSRFERGGRNPSPTMLRLFAAVYKKSVAELYEPPRRTAIDRMLMSRSEETQRRVEALVEAYLSQHPD